MLRSVLTHCGFTKWSTAYEAGLKNDKLPLLFLENRNAKVAVKTSGGLSKRVNIKNIIINLNRKVLHDELKLSFSDKLVLYFVSPGPE